MVIVGVRVLGFSGGEGGKKIRRVGKKKKYPRVAD